MLDTANGNTLDLGPVDAVIEGLIDQANETDIVATDDKEAQGSFLAGLSIFRFANDAFNRVLKDLLCFGQWWSLSGRKTHAWEAKR